MTSGEPISTGGDGNGPLSSGGIQSIPIGSANVYDSPRPDLFVTGDRWYPGVYLYRWIDDLDSVPVFGEPLEIAVPRTENKQATGSVYQTSDGEIHAVWLDGAEVVFTIFDLSRKSFVEVGRVRLGGLPAPPGSIGVWPAEDARSDRGFEVLLGVCSGIAYRPKNQNHRESDYRPFDGAGVWRGGLPRVGLYAAFVRPPYDGDVTARLVSATPEEVHGGHYTLSKVALGASGLGIVAGSRFGLLHVYRGIDSSGLPEGELPEEPLSRREVVGTDGIFLRHPACKPSPICYPGKNGEETDLIVGGECSLYYYRYTGDCNAESHPIYHSPVPVLEKGAPLYGGTLPVVNVVDLDGDGLPDIVAGNSEGRILFFKNDGAEGEPSFLPGIPLEAEGEEICIQPGYYENIQGPGESRWGYTCPTVVDWNYDGRLDIVMSDSTARHTLFLNRGRSEAEFGRGRPIYLDGLEIHGTWRVKPGVHDIEGRMAYVMLDDDDELHLYWRIDDYNLRDGGKLHLDDGSSIKANFLEAGGTGRLKINLVDWDGDGLIDLLIGTPRHGSVPNPTDGLPQSLGLPGSAVLFLKNSGTNTAPVYQFPQLMRYKGKSIFLGQHACGPAPAFLRPGSLPDLIVGRENGRIYYYSRSDLSPV